MIALPATPAAAQGRDGYMNVESRQVHPIEVARISGHDYLLAVNTPENTLEVWDTDESVPVASRRLARIRVGLEPVSVRWVGGLGTAYVANFLGDSITAIGLKAPDGPGSFTFNVKMTENVSDEPLDLVHATVIDPDDGSVTETLFVTHHTLDAFGAYDAGTLQPVAAGAELQDAVLSSGADLDFDGAIDDIAIKVPWTLGVACDRLFILGHLGGNTVRYDFDLYSRDLAGGGERSLGGLGSTNWNMAFAASGELYLVGAEARNDLRDEVNVAAAESGFVESTFYLVENPCSDNPTVHRRDVNLEKKAQQHEVPQETPVLFDGRGGRLDSMVVPQPVIGPVAKGEALAQLTSLVSFTDDGGTDKVFFTAMSSDRLGIIEPDAATAPIDWPIRRIAISPVAVPGAMAGPRGLALKEANPADPDDAGARVYVLNRLDNSVSIVDPVTETVVDGFALQDDSTPAHVRDGRRFLYDARLSGNGFDSCSSCHLDGRTDGLAWDLGDGNSTPIPPEILPFHDGFPTSFPADKEFMVTQSLQGLLNFEVTPDVQNLFTNAPYHWRGDRDTFVAFNPAFVALLGGDELSTADMEAFEEFVNSIHYPPNPKQPRPRVFSGSIGDPNGAGGSDALLGLKVYHLVSTDGFACVHCHALPEGSDNVLTENIPGNNPHPVVDPPLPLAPAQPIETAALRGLFQKEARLDRDGSDIHEQSPITGYEGLLHTGLADGALNANSNDFNGTATINAFNRFFFSGLCGTLQPLQSCALLDALNQFVHEFDFGSGPMIGASLTVSQANVGLASTTQAFDDAELQAELANAGVAVQAWIDGVRRGFWYDLSGVTPVYTEEPGGAGFSRAALLALLASPRDRLVLLSPPLGSERRVADPDGVPAFRDGPEPTAIELLPMVTNTAYSDVPAMSFFWENPNFTPSPAEFGGPYSHTIRAYQNGILDDGPAGGFGLCSVRHEAPRRLRVAGDHIRHGARLELRVPDDLTPPNTSLRPEEAGQINLLTITLPIHPTGELAGERRVWQTAVEFEPLIFYRLMAGKPTVAGQPATFLAALDDLDSVPVLDPESQPGTFAPIPWNQHWVRVVNADGSSGSGGWQALTIQPGPDCP